MGEAHEGAGAGQAIRAAPDWSGMPLADWGENDRPVLVLACFLRPPAAAAGGGWERFEAACDGFACQGQTGCARLLRVLPEPPWGKGVLLDPIDRLLAEIWEERFAGSHGLDYGPTAEDEAAYRGLLSSHGLSWSPRAHDPHLALLPHPARLSGTSWTPPHPASMRGQLRQAVYPFDATDANLAVLTSGQHGSVHSLLGEDPASCGAWLVLLGQNCD